MQNTKIEYLYRDASNYKQWNEAVLAGEFTKDDIDKIRDVMDGEFFCPEQVGLPLVRPDDSYTEDDHCWSELDPEGGISFTDEAPTVDLTWRQLVENFCKVKETGWRPEEYEPVPEEIEEEMER